MSLTKEKEEELVQRIYYRQMELAEQRRKDHEEELERQRKMARKVIPAANLRDLVQRVHDQQIQQKIEAQNEAESKKYESLHQKDKKLDSGAIDELVRRVYDDAIAAHKAEEEKLEARYLPTCEGHKMSKEDIAAASVRLYTIDWEERDKKLFAAVEEQEREDLEKKNLRKIGEKPITPSTEAAMVARLATKG